MYLLRSLAAGLGAAAIAYGLNWLVLRRIGGRGLWLVVPAVEEGLKTGAALLLVSSVPVSHAFFGLVEAGYELRCARPAPLAACLALVTHCVFGLATAWLLALGGAAGPAVVAVAAMHAVFNLAVTRVPVRTGGPRTRQHP